jgi:hypothetical protein
MFQKTVIFVLTAVTTLELTYEYTCSVYDY